MGCPFVFLPTFQDNQFDDAEKALIFFIIACYHPIKNDDWTPESAAFILGVSRLNVG
jgi:hypothetical protein